jgi:hypothetical protein
MREFLKLRPHATVGEFAFLCRFLRVREMMIRSRRHRYAFLDKLKDYNMVNGMVIGMDVGGEV